MEFKLEDKILTSFLLLLQLTDANIVFLMCNTTNYVNI